MLQITVCSEKRSKTTTKIHQCDENEYTDYEEHESSNEKRRNNRERVIESQPRYCLSNPTVLDYDAQDIDKGIFGHNYSSFREN